MGKYGMIKKEFKFLEEMYGFKVCMKQKHGSYYYIIWTNSIINIMVLYDEQDEDNPSIRIYDSESFIFDATEHKSEFLIAGVTPREKIHAASNWLKESIAAKKIVF